MLGMPTFGRKRTLVGIALAACFTAGATTVPPPTVVSNSTIRVYVRGDAQGPRLAWIEGSKDNLWSNQAVEPLPASVEINGAAVPLTWQLRPDWAPTIPAKPSSSTSLALRISA